MLFVCYLYLSVNNQRWKFFIINDDDDVDYKENYDDDEYDCCDDVDNYD